MIVVARHGARHPIFIPPNWPYPLPKEELGFLTDKGIFAKIYSVGEEEMRKLGSFIRRKYANFLQSLDPTNIHARASDCQRYMIK